MALMVFVGSFALFFGLLPLGLAQRKPVYLILATASLIVGLAVKHEMHAPAARSHAGAVAHTGAAVSVKSSPKRTGTRWR